MTLVFHFDLWHISHRIRHRMDIVCLSPCFVFSVCHWFSRLSLFFLLQPDTPGLCLLLLICPAHSHEQSNLYLCVQLRLSVFSIHIHSLTRPLSILLDCSATFTCIVELISAAAFDTWDCCFFVLTSFCEIFVIFCFPSCPLFSICYPFPFPSIPWGGWGVLVVIFTSWHIWYLRLLLLHFDEFLFPSRNTNVLFTFLTYSCTYPFC